MQRIWAVFGGVLVAGTMAASGADRSAMQAVPFDQVTIQDAFWLPRMETNRTTTVPHDLRLCEETGRIDNFAKAGGLIEGKFKGKFYDDSDVYKCLEGAAYTLVQHPDPKLEARIDAIIDKIAAAQEADGYINSYYTLAEPDKKWTNLDHMHELYCAGHMFEAAVAYHRATGKDKLLKVARGMADHIDTIFGHDKRIGYPGHEEIELALVKLYRETGETRYRDLAKFFVDVRGTVEDTNKPEYRQAHEPVREQSEVVGHAVRAMYLYAGVVDVAGLSGDQSLIDAMERIWRSVALHKMYVTGAIGSSHHGEAFGPNYDLPNRTAYCETCASIGMALWNQRLLLMHGEGRFGDVLERVMYNAVLAGVALTGDRFFYVNPLESDGGHHRKEWYGTACCPSNVVRFLPSVGGYLYGTSDHALWINLYVASTAEATVGNHKVKVTQETQYPWAGRVEITLAPDQPADFELRLRIPAWCTSASARVNGKAIDNLNVEAGYANIRRQWKAGDTIELDLPMPIQRIQAHPKVAADRWRVALQRGPIVYCLEAVDNDGDVFNLALPRDAQLEAEFKPDLLGGVVVLKGQGVATEKTDWTDTLYLPESNRRSVPFTAVPYAVWDNRQAGQMVVWIPESSASAN